MRRAHSRLWGLFWTAFVLTLVGSAFTAAFFITSFFFGLTRLAPPPLVTQLVNSFLGLFLTALVLWSFSRFFRRQQLNAFEPILQALERIAQGDFSIRLEDEHADGVLSNLVASVNKMALGLDQMETMRQEFISNVSHEIQSPLTSIRGFAQALHDDTLGAEDRRHYLDIIELESRRLSRLTDDLLKLASLEAEQVKFAPRPYRLDKQLRSVVLACEPQWRDKALAVDAVLDEISITADEDLLSQVWTNLIHNSIKFTPEGGAIRVRLHRRGDQVACRVADTGPGIAPEDRVHIFERFYKADKSRTGAEGGSGLGLSIVKKIVDLHRGEIQVESGEGQGAVFTVLLPLE